MKVGFTGTQHGMTSEQLARVVGLLAALGGGELHHGDCIGADVEAAEAARVLAYRLVCHPPLDDAKRGFVTSDEYWTPLPYLARNRAIVQAAEILIAAPYERTEQVRSGTWATIRYARAANVPVVEVLP